jgi:hypothetical protein
MIAAAAVVVAAAVGSTADAAIVMIACCRCHGQDTRILQQAEAVVKGAGCNRWVSVSPSVRSSSQTSESITLNNM